MSVALSKTKMKRRPFEKYSAYVTRLQALMSQTRDNTRWDQQVEAALNGEASLELRRRATLKTRRRYGAYFTGTTLSERLLIQCASFDGERTFYDPSCGMGDLLLSAARNFPLARTLVETLVQWGQRLAGTDLHAEFIEGARTRLMLLARQRHQSTETHLGPLDEFFPQIRVGDGLGEETAFQKATTLLMNPPFGFAKSPVDCKWASGRVSEAATFMVTALERIQPGTEVLAILPEVLRSGSFSEQWRKRVSELAEVHRVEPYGIFDESADIDVFLLRLVRRGEGKHTNRKRWPLPRATQHSTVADYFDVHVGRVVPHRDKKAGPRHPYIHPRCVPTWKVMREFSETRKHKGAVYKPPFVAIRRTSRPGDVYRATGTAIAGKCAIAVENHLIVCEPKDKTLAMCKKLLRQLKTEAVNEYLDNRIRCRHLTVSAVKSIPFAAT